jgi:hypothetical protein
MGVHVGTWIYSDTLKALVFTIKNPDGTAFNLTDYTVAAEIRVPGATALAATVTGSVTTAASGIGQVVLGATAALQPSAAGGTVQYEAYIKCTKGADVRYAGKGTDGGEPFSFIVRRWP